MPISICYDCDCITSLLWDCGLSNSHPWTLCLQIIRCYMSTVCPSHRLLYLYPSCFHFVLTSLSLHLFFDIHILLSRYTAFSESWLEPPISAYYVYIYGLILKHVSYKVLSIKFKMHNFVPLALLNQRCWLWVILNFTLLLNLFIDYPIVDLCSALALSVRVHRSSLYKSLNHVSQIQMLLITACHRDTFCCQIYQRTEVIWLPLHSMRGSLWDHCFAWFMHILYICSKKTGYACDYFRFTRNVSWRVNHASWPDCTGSILSWSSLKGLLNVAHCEYQHFAWFI